jgi:hypothetical protein
MNAVIFTGPTISVQHASEVLKALYLPPVAQGDIIRVTRLRPTVIGIIDGYFERMPAVWHKEILYAMSKGVHVFGSSSMGALRAAELAAFGMEGVGAIYEAFLNGQLEDDDEVAVVHGSTEDGYRVMSEAMVNVRATLDRAVAEGVLPPPRLTLLLRITKELFYPERNYSHILQKAVAEGMPMGEAHQLQKWLNLHKIDQKREDARHMLHKIYEFLAANPGPKCVNFHFEHTEWWDRAKRLAGQINTEKGEVGETTLLDAILGELRLDGVRYANARQGAILRSLALEEANRQGRIVDQETLQKTTDNFRRERDLLDSESVQAWMSEQQLSFTEFTRLMKDEALIDWTKRIMEAEGTGKIPDFLRVTGEYTKILERARSKQRTLKAAGVWEPSLSETDLAEEELWRWYFEERLARPVPSDVAQFAKAIGYLDVETFQRDVLREFWYVCRLAPQEQVVATLKLKV